MSKPTMSKPTMSKPTKSEPAKSDPTMSDPTMSERATPDAKAPFSRRFRAYLAERFPLGPYSLLILAMVAAAVAATGGPGGGAVPVGPRTLLAFLVVLLAFFHLRVFDEHKDAAADRLAHPDRLLSRGVVTLRELAAAGAVAVALQAALAGLLGVGALVWWAAAFGYTVVMRFEFFASDWLRRHVLVYLVSHNPVVALLVAFVAAAHAGAGVAGPLAAGPLAFGAIATFTSLGFEVGRKLRAPDDEKAGQETYTAALGVRGAVALLVVIEVLAAGSAIGAALVLDLRGLLPWVGPLLCLLPVGLALRFARTPTRAAAKAVDGAASGAALLLYVVLALDVFLKQGITWTIGI